MNTIRAEVVDMPRILPCARTFCKAIGWPLDEFHLVDSMQKLIQDGSGASFLLEEGAEIVGGIGGVIREELIGKKRVAVEIFWFVNADRRGGFGPIRLLDKFEQWARDSGAENICMISVEGSDPEQMDKLYKRLGYRKLETLYIK